jgi:hypothetical protein
MHFDARERSDIAANNWTGFQAGTIHARTSSQIDFHDVWTHAYKVNDFAVGPPKELAQLPLIVDGHAERLLGVVLGKLAEEGCKRKGLLAN